MTTHPGGDMSRQVMLGVLVIGMGHGTPIMGGFNEKTTLPPDNSKRQIVRGYAIMGDVDVRN